MDHDRKRLNSSSSLKISDERCASEHGSSLRGGSARVFGNSVEYSYNSTAALSLGMIRGEAGVPYISYHITILMEQTLARLKKKPHVRMVDLRCSDLVRIFWPLTLTLTASSLLIVQLYLGALEA